MEKIRYLLLLIPIFLLIFSISQNNDENESVMNNNFENNMYVENNIIENQLEGKTIAFIGDSLVEGYSNEFRGFDYYLKKELPHTKFINNSKSGSTITDNSGTDNIIMINQVKTLSGNPDIIVFDGGANDIIGYALGFLNNDLKKNIGKIEMDKLELSAGDSVIVDLEEIVLEMKNKFPNAKLCYIQAFTLDEQTINNLSQEEVARKEIKQRRDEFFLEMQKLCQKWNIEYIDLSKNIEGTGTTYRQEDWIHLKEFGYEKLTPYLLNKIKEI